MFSVIVVASAIYMITMVLGQILEVDNDLVTACLGPECNDVYQADMMHTKSNAADSE